MKTRLLLLLLAAAFCTHAQTYPQRYFRNPLDIPMELVANFGELRTNHWHMGLDIRTQRRENLPVRAAAEGYISAVSVDATGFGRAIYINHPNGFTTVYAHLNNFEPTLNAWLKARQYEVKCWAGKWTVPQNLFPVNKGDFIAYSGNTGGSQGPHVHFEIRNTKTEECLNPLLFGFPIPDAVPPTLQRLALYDRSQSVYAQKPTLAALKKTGSNYSLTIPVLNVASNKISFAIGAVDRFTGYTNPNGIYSARIWLDGVLQSGFVLDSISYDDTRYLNAQIDYRLKAAHGPYLQHLSKLPGERSTVYENTTANGIISLADTLEHAVLIEVFDAAGNRSPLRFNLKYKPNFFKTPYSTATEKLVPNEVNVFERPGFELYTSELALYDTVNSTYSEAADAAPGSCSAKYLFLNATIPTHDSVTVRLQITRALTHAEKDRIIIVNTAGEKIVVQKATCSNDWACAKFRQFGSFQAFVDTVPPTVNAPGVGDTINLTRATRLVFHPKDNFKKIRSVRAELDGQWLLLSNDKALAYIYQFDNYFLPGVHQLKVTIEDIARNVTEKTWWVRR
jgi:hypothetical protein